MAINEVCATNESTVKNPNGFKQCPETSIRLAVFAKEGFSYDSVEAFKLEENTDNAIIAKNIIPSYIVEENDNANTEDTLQEGTFTEFVTAKGKRGVTLTFYTSVCSDEFLNSIKNSEYKRFFSVNAGGDVSCRVVDGKVYGEKIRSLRVNVREGATPSAVPKTIITIIFDDQFKDVLVPSFDFGSKEGVYDVKFDVVNASATEITFKTLLGCSGTPIKSLESADVQVVDASGEALTGVTFTGANAEGVYTLTGTGFASGFKLQTVGVIAKGNLLEGSETLAI